MSCDNVITVQDLETDKKHSTFYREVITGKAGGTGAYIDFATNAVTGQAQKTLSATIDGLDWSFVGKFADGVTFTKKTDFAIDASGTQWIYVGTSPFPVVVPSGTVPSAPNYQVAHVGTLQALGGLTDPSDLDTVFARTFTSKSSMIAFSEHQLGNKYLTFEGGKYAIYEVVSSASDVPLVGGLWAKLLDLDVRQPLVSDADIGEQVLRQKTSAITDSQLGTTKLRLIAHRGMGFTEQNTLSDYGYALALGADGLEIDIKFSSDGVPVLFHDDTVDALTDGTGLIESKTIAQIRALKFKNLVGTTYENERIPLFDDFMRMVKKSGAIVIVEVKSYNKTQTDAVAQIVVDYSMERNVIFASFNMGILQNYVDYVPGCNIAYYGGSTTGDIDALSAIKFAGAKYVYAQGGAFTQANFRYAIARGVSYISGTTTTTNAYALGKLNGANLTVTDVMGGRII